MERVVAILLDEIKQFIVCWAIGGLVEMDRVTNPGREASEGVVVLWDRMLVM